MALHPRFRSADQNAARRGGQQTCGQLDKGGLSAAIGADDAGDTIVELEENLVGKGLKSLNFNAF